MQDGNLHADDGKPKIGGNNMDKYIFLKNELSADDVAFYSHSFDGLTATSDCLRHEYENGATNYVIFKGNHTPYCAVRDCGDHWIRAGYSSYYRIDKATMQETATDYDR